MPLEKVVDFFVLGDTLEIHCALGHNIPTSSALRHSCQAFQKSKAPLLENLIW